MSNEESYRFALTLFKPDETSLGQFPVEMDWEPAIEWTRFLALRRGAGEARQEAEVEPIWHGVQGPPYVQGFRVRLGSEAPASFPLAYFADGARAIAAGLVDSGELGKGDAYLYQPLAYRRASSEQKRSPFVTEDVTPAVDLEEVALDELRAGASRQGVIAEDEDEMPALLPQAVLEEVKSLAATAGSIETGGVLLGRLGRDKVSGELACVVSAQVHARHARSDSTSLHFTADTWTEVRQVMALRGEGELMVGWWHSHPVSAWCRRCSEESQRRCTLARDFYSEHDRALHRTVSPKAYSLGLVVNAVGYGEFTLSLFGWKNGILDSRGFHATEVS